MIVYANAFVIKSPFGVTENWVEDFDKGRDNENTVASKLNVNVFAVTSLTLSKQFWFQF